MISCERDVVICKCWKAESKNKVYRTHVILKFSHFHEGKKKKQKILGSTHKIWIFILQKKKKLSETKSEVTTLQKLTNDDTKIFNTW